MAKKIAWTHQAKAGVRSIDRETALDLLHGLARFLATEQGDVKRLQDDGGFKIINPPDVADFLLRELSEQRFTGNVVGIWD